MKYLILDDLNSFECIGSECTYTCCANWNISIDPKSTEYYHNVEGPLGEKLKKNIVVRNETNFFKLKEGRCPFLNEQSLCDIYVNLGKDHMCTTCKVYPRKNWSYGDLTFIGKHISCPEIARILFTSPSPLSFSFSEDLSIPNSNFDWTIFNQYIKGMTISIEILQNHELIFSNRMRALLLFNYYFQNHLNSGRDCTELFDLFSSATSILQLIEHLSHTTTNGNSRIALFLAIAQNIKQILDNDPIIESLSFGINFLKTIKLTNPKQLWEFQNQSDNNINFPHIHEQYGVYYIAMYYMDSIKDKLPFRCITQFFILFYLQNCFELFAYKENKENLSLSKIIDIYTRTARVYEHSNKNYNLQTTFSLLEEKDMTSLAFLLSLI